VELEFTVHALKRMIEMSVTLEEVRDAVERPEVDYSTPSYGATSRNAKKGRITVAYDGNIVITVLWNTQDNYKR
jgi:hypothetical protein